MIGGSSSAVENYAQPDISSIAGIKITKLPDGRALGCDDLQRWSHNRLRGRFGVSPHSIEKTADGKWVILLSSGKTIDGFKSRRAAWEWIKRRRSRRC
jgi:hypothetical protein